MEQLELNIFFWSKDQEKYSNMIDKLLKEGWIKLDEIPYFDNKDRVYKYEVNLIRNIPDFAVMD